MIVKDSKIMRRGISFLATAALLINTFFLPADAAGAEYELTVDETKTVRSVGRIMYGTNFEWGGYNNGGKFYVKENTNEINPEFVKAASGNLPLCRMAGNSANSMQWKKAVGEYPADRLPLQFWSYSPTKISYGPTEWIKSTKAADSDAQYTYTVNLTTDTLDNMADLVRFMTLTPDDEKAVGTDGINWAQKRIDYGIAEPVPIKAWELGNELDLESNGAYDAQQYAAMCKAAINAIRSVDPEAKIAAHTVTLSSENEEAWLETLLKETGADIDYISVHCYYDPNKVYEVDNRLNFIKNAVKKYTGSNRIKILMTEHASARYSDDVNAGYKYWLPHTMKGVLATAEYFCRAMKHPELEASTYHSTYSSSWCSLYPEDGTVKRTATGELLDLFGHNMVGEAVDCSIGGFETEKYSGIAAAAVKTDSGLNVVLVNGTQNKINIKMNFGGSYDLIGKSVISAPSFESDNFIGRKEISYASDSIFESNITTCSVGPTSVVLLKLKQKNSKALIKFFVEDFEKYQTVEYIRNNAVINAKPKNDDYSDTEVYPKGTASVFEGNAMNNVTVKDAYGNDIPGGLDGWFGFYNGERASYYSINRRLSVVDYASEADRATNVNSSKTLKIEPHKNTDALAAFDKNFVDLDGYSSLSARVSLSSDVLFGKFAVAVTKNPENKVRSDKRDTVYDEKIDLVSFEGTADKKIDIIFNGEKAGQIPKSKFNTDTARTWYTVNVKLYNNGSKPKIALYIVEDSTGSVAAKRGWEDFDCKGSFTAERNASYGIRFYAESAKDTAQPRVLLDDIKFVKESFTEDFNEYNTNEVVTQINSSDRITNGAFGNLNADSTYENGVYEGNITKNNYIYNNLIEKVYGSSPLWQGYLSSVSSADAYNKTGRRCSIIKAPAWHQIMKSNILSIDPKSYGGNKQISYAGMENVDFDDKTEWRSTISVPLASQNTGVFKLQLTKGRSITDANGSANAEPAAEYDGRSHKAYYDVLTLKDGKMYFGSGETPICSYSTGSKTAYEAAYTVDRLGSFPTESLRVTDLANGEIIADIPARKMDLTGEFNFNDDIIGIRYVSETGSGSGVFNKVYVDDISINKSFASEITAVSDKPKVLKCDIDENGKVALTLLMNENRSVTFVCGIFSDDGTVKAVKAETKYCYKGNNEPQLDVPLPSDYNTGKYTVKIFFLDSLGNLSPIAEDIAINQNVVM